MDTCVPYTSSKMKIGFQRSVCFNGLAVVRKSFLCHFCASPLDPSTMYFEPHKLAAGCSMVTSLSALNAGLQKFLFSNMTKLDPHLVA